ncbi:2,3-bisphosphoglycerate-dependent phosphoglycerate mutase [Salirhabdus euzebyi]|uniref:2,3-bisphosphoglycerate-dependent phosphoglycerate mutase n=1 Tax=Salirhabdus euzebyi TaxID=394506 RepID=A0A841Q2X3_9BACI|nr:2,3-bisphosphoglycerate-dependent phosphoglycerate mutase [Salirhabdus euzebyi]
MRHAHSTYTPDELGRPLSERGFLDAHEVTGLLQNENIDHIVSSPYKRAIQTVEGLAKYVDKKIEIVDGYKERKLAEGAVENFDLAIKKVWNDFDFAWEGGESNHTAQKRGVDAIVQLIDQFNGQNIVISTHGNIMVLIMNYFDPRYDFSFWEQLTMPDIYKLTFDSTQLIDVSRIWSP